MLTPVMLVRCPSVPARWVIVPRVLVDHRLGMPNPLFGLFSNVRS